MHRVPHSPELMRTGSNVAHWVIGTILGVAALLALVQVLPGRVDLRLWWSAGLAVLGLLFVLFLILHHGFRLLPAWIADLMEDPQQRQHLVMGLLLLLDLGHIALGRRLLEERFDVESRAVKGSPILIGLRLWSSSLAGHQQAMYDVSIGV